MIFFLSLESVRWSEAGASKLPCFEGSTASFVSVYSLPWRKVLETSTERLVMGMTHC